MAYDAAEFHFLGSPSVQIEGKDIETERRGDASNFACRLYTYEGRRTGVSPKTMIHSGVDGTKG